MKKENTSCSIKKIFALYFHIAKNISIENQCITSIDILTDLVYNNKRYENKKRIVIGLNVLKDNALIDFSLGIDYVKIKVIKKNMLKITLSEIEYISMNDIYIYSIIRNGYNFKTNKSQICKSDFKEICKISTKDVEKSIKNLLYNNAIEMLSYYVIYDVSYIKNKNR